jgi:Ca-activated chloride channel homolog
MRYYKATLFPIILTTAMLAALCLGAISPVYGQDKTNEQNQEQPDIIKLNTSLVTLPVMVSDPYGRFVTGLTRQDFQVREDGVLQQIASFSTTEAPFNVALLIDTSRSTRNKLGAIRKAALEFIKQLQPRDRVLIVTFDERVNFLGDFTSDRRELARTIRSVKSNYLTSLYDAISLTITEKLATVAGRKAIVVLTDGVDTFSGKATFESSLDLVAGTGVICYAVQYETRGDAGPLTNPILLPRSSFNYHSSAFVPHWQGQATPPKDRYLIAQNYLSALTVRSGALLFRAETIENTSFAFALIANELRNQYTISYYSGNDKRDGNYRTIAVNINRAGFNPRTRQGYRVEKIEQSEEGKETKKSTDGAANKPD